MTDDELADVLAAFVEEVRGEARARDRESTAGQAQDHEEAMRFAAMRRVRG
jgi:hypothetical protein